MRGPQRRCALLAGRRAGPCSLVGVAERSKRLELDKTLRYNMSSRPATARLDRYLHSSAVKSQSWSRNVPNVGEVLSETVLWGPGTVVHHHYSNFGSPRGTHGPPHTPPSVFDRHAEFFVQTTRIHPLESINDSLPQHVLDQSEDKGYPGPQIDDGRRRECCRRGLWVALISDHGLADRFDVRRSIRDGKTSVHPEGLLRSKPRERGPHNKRCRGRNRHR